MICRQDIKSVFVEDRDLLCCYNFSPRAHRIYLASGAYLCSQSFAMGTHFDTRSIRGGASPDFCRRSEFVERPRPSSHVTSPSVAKEAKRCDVSSFEVFRSPLPWPWLAFFSSRRQPL